MFSNNQLALRNPGEDDDSGYFVPTSSSWPPKSKAATDRDAGKMVG